MRRHLPAAVVLTALGLALGGCGESPTAQVRAKVQQLVQATAKHDYATICGQVLAPSLVARVTSTGLTCPQAMALALGSVHHPVVSIGKVAVRGPLAWAITLTSAQGQRASLSAIRLRLTSHGWRIIALSSSVAAAARK